MPRLAIFLAELKRRRVFRVAVVYAGVAFIIIQIIDGAFDYLPIPDWVGTAIIVLLLAGFPIAVGLAWAFDITEKGVVRTAAKEEATKAKKSPRIVIGNKALVIVASGLLVLIIVGGLFLWRNYETRRILTVVTRLQTDIEAGHLDEVFYQLQASSMDIDDARIENLMKRITGTFSIETNPSDMAVTVTRVQPISTFIKRQPMAIGHTPITERQLVAGEYLVSLAGEGMNPLQFIIYLELGEELSITRTVLPPNVAWEGMVVIEKGTSPEGRNVPAFLIDRNEVTNAEFLNFVAAGGYRDPTYWPETIIVHDQPSAWDVAIHTFTDKTGIPGPRFWSGGTYPKGKGDHPVVGISWYEAAAYAHWAGKDLPTWDQWWRAAVGNVGGTFPWGNDVRTTDLRANFGLIDTRPVSSYPLGISPFGCFDMAGNVRE